MDGVQLSQGYRTTTRKHITFYHYSFYFLPRSFQSEIKRHFSFFCKCPPLDIEIIKNVADTTFNLSFLKYLLEITATFLAPYKVS